MYNNNYINPYSYGNQNYNMPSQPYYGNMQNTSDYGMQGVKFVTQDEAKAYLVMPNQRVMLMDKNNSLFYIKSADSLGQSTLEAYEFKKVDISSPQPKENAAPNFDMEKLVKREELDKLVNREEFAEKLSTVAGDLTQKIEELRKSISIKKYLEGEIKDV